MCLYDILTTRQTVGKMPVFDILQVVRRIEAAQVNMHAYVYRPLCQRLLRIPVHLQPRYIVVVIVRLFVLGDKIRVPLAVVSHHAAFAAVDVGNLDYTMAADHLDLGGTVRITVVLIRQIFTRRNVADGYIFLGIRTFQVVIDVRIPPAFLRADKIAVARFTLREKRYLEVNLVHSGRVRRVVFRLFQEVIRPGLLRHSQQDT